MKKWNQWFTALPAWKKAAVVLGAAFVAGFVGETLKWIF